MIRMNRNVGVALVVAALSAAGIGAAVKAEEDHTTTFTFNFPNAKLTSIDSAQTVTGSSLTGTASVPNVGPVDLVGRLFLTEGVHGSGTLTVRKNKSDKIFFTLSSGEIDSTREFECTMTITGGTGTYEFAKGTGLVEGTVGKATKGSTNVSFIAQGVISF